MITALEGARYGVRANAIAPGGATRMVNEAMPSIPVREANEVADDEFEPLNPGNSAPMVAWLASDESLLVSGQVFRAVGNEIAHYLGWHLGPSVANATKGDPVKWDPARIGTAAGQERLRPPARRPADEGLNPAAGGPDGTRAPAVGRSPRCTSRARSSSMRSWSKPRSRLVIT